MMATTLTHDSVCFVLQVSPVKVKHELIPHRQAGLISRGFNSPRVPLSDGI